MPKHKHKCTRYCRPRQGLHKCHSWCEYGRHVFTHEESMLGFQRAKAKVDGEHPDWKCAHGKNLSHCLLRAKNPRFFALRDAVVNLEKQVSEIRKRQGRDDRKLDRIEQELAALKKLGDRYNGDLRSYLNDYGMVDTDESVDNVANSRAIN